MDACIANIMYCQRLFLLFTGKQHCLNYIFFRGTYLFKFGGVTVLAVQLFNNIKRKKEKKKKEEDDKEQEKTCFAVLH